MGTILSYLLIFSSPNWPALWGEESGNSLGGHQAFPREMSHSLAGVEYFEARYDWQALVEMNETITKNLILCTIKL